MTRLPELGPRGVGWVLIQGILLVVIGAAGTVGPAWAGAARVVTSAAGALLIVAGGSMAVRGSRDLGRALTPLPHPRADAELVETGIYAHVRHPIYGGLVVAAVGWGLLTASPVALVGAVLLLIFFELKSRREEAWLEHRYAGYADYRRRTRRLIPWIG